MNLTRLFIIIGIISVLLVLFLSGMLVYPLNTIKRINRKKTYPAIVQESKVYETEPLPQTIYDWKLSRPNITIYCLVAGGFGNSMIALASAFDACIHLGIRPPVLFFESGSDFDFHKLDAPRYEFPDTPSGITEMFPSLNSIVAKSVFSIWGVLDNWKFWEAKSLESFPIGKNVVLLPHYKQIYRLSDAAWAMARKSLNPKIIDYINRNYNIRPNTMAVHLRLGQPTDDFFPPHPSEQDVVNFHQSNQPGRVIVFTDNREKAVNFMSKTNLPYELISETNYIEFILLSMCEMAIISESTFSVCACRLGNIKNVSLPDTKRAGFTQDDAWTHYPVA